MKRYVSAMPYFSQRQIMQILSQTRAMLKGADKLSMGEHVRAFEEAFALYCGVRQGIATSSCSCALDVVFKALKLQAGDEVIVPTQTFFANASSVLLNGITLRLVGVNKDFMLTQELIESALTPQVKAIVIVHFAGLISPDIFHIANLAKQRQITLIEDCSHAHGAIAIDTKGVAHKAGSIGDVGVFSFYSTKILTTGEGGMIMSNHKTFINTCRAIANRGLKPQSVIEDFTTLGNNYRMPSFSAILGLAGLEHLEKALDKRERLTLAYKRHLRALIDNGTLRFQAIPKGFRHSFWRCIVFLHKHKASAILTALKSKQIHADAPYKPLLHKQPFLQHHPLVCATPSCEEVEQNHISLPLHEGLTLKDIAFISNTLKEVLHAKA
ncbi:DegT/DnrJ/EryC1/StrS family aminotransferase [Helicobacter marmotae]|uniref:DegT/DnrJ/EryC1/StrS family aminotransferase n=1 Tax=Helicobacter marmotae TaxID=152490 RepID=A0A3D8I6F3_9HELI|nr:DegT/DnrJ/EryC1/StrS family aminotransferase [Helicobacter marmotae]RDU60697.1 DegT/DnrJ/EryC1/StrS family aminotransferase [Helicobacter marmotae]